MKMSQSKTSPLFKVSPDDWASWSQQLQSESERGMATTAVAILDHLLGRLIEGFLLDDFHATKKLLGDALSPLGSFSARIALTYSLGLISKDERDDLDSIRKIRNAFVHQPISPSFSDESIATMVSSLKTIQLIKTEISSTTTMSPKAIFRDVASMLSTFIDIRTHRNTERRVSPGKFVIQTSKPA